MAVVEYDDGPGVDVFRDSPDDGSGVGFPEVVGQQTPEDHPMVVFLHESLEAGVEPAVGGPEEGWFLARDFPDGVVGLRDLVPNCVPLPEDEKTMIEAVVSDGVALVLYFSDDSRMAEDFLSDEEEGGPGLVALQDL